MCDPDSWRRFLASGQTSPNDFRAALTSIPERERDTWVNHVFGLEDLPTDGPELPRGCVPYLPCSVDALLRMTEIAGVQADDVFVDIGSGAGRAAVLTHFLTGASAIGVEIQPALVRRSRELAARLNAARVSVIEGDAARLTRDLKTGTVFFLYCPFGGARVDQFVDDLTVLAEARSLRVCSVDLTLPSRSWLIPVSVSRDLAVYRTSVKMPRAPSGRSEHRQR